MENEMFVLSVAILFSIKLQRIFINVLFYFIRWQVTGLDEEPDEETIEASVIQCKPC